MRIVPPGRRCARWRQRDARLLRELHDALGRAVEPIDGDEIAALGLRPRGEARAGEPSRQMRVDGIELRRDQRPVRFHVPFQPGEVAEEAHMPQLVHLVRADRAEERAAHEPGEVGGRSREERETRPCHRHLRCRGEDERPLGAARRRASLQDVRDRDTVVGQVVDGVGIVPEEPEIRCARRHRGQPADRLV